MILEPIVTVDTHVLFLNCMFCCLKHMKNISVTSTQTQITVE